MARRIQKEVAARLDPDELKRFQNVISQEAIGDESTDNDEDYEDASASDESEQESPTPATRKGKGPLSRGEKVFLDADRSWTAAEAEEAQLELSGFFVALAESFAKEATKNEGQYTRLSGDTVQTLDRADGLAYMVGQVQKHTQDSAKVVQSVAKAVDSLAKTAATKLTGLDKEVKELTQRRTTDDLERKVEEISGQLVSLAQRSRQQQDLLERILCKVEAPFLSLAPTPTPPPAPATPRPRAAPTPPLAPATPRPRAAPTRPPSPAVSREVTMSNTPVQASPPPPTPALVLTTVRRGSRRGSPRHPIKTSGAIKYLDIYLTRK